MMTTMSSSASTLTSEPLHAWFRLSATGDCFSRSQLKQITSPGVLTQVSECRPRVRTSGRRVVERCGGEWRRTWPARGTRAHRALPEGDDSAFGELVDLYKNLVYGLVYRMVSRPVARRRSRAGSVPEGLPRLAVFSRRSAAVDLDLSASCRTSAPRRGRAGRPTSRSIRKIERRRRFEPARGRRCVWRSGAARPPRKGDRPAARTAAPADRRALSRTACSTRALAEAHEHPARHGEDAPLPGEKAIAGAVGRVTCTDAAGHRGGDSRW